ncbi:MAG: tetratricopeptide repeat protein [Spirosomaceae bacterium]|jgi:two-component sensor histidine kinase|nr:tetratricopeptide repeat protein [Spirosomataceae bacterium]
MKKIIITVYLGISCLAVSAQQYQKVYEKIMQMPDDTVKFDSLSNWALGFRLIEKKLCKQYLETAQKIAVKINDEKRIALANYYIGLIERILGRYQSALEYYLRAYPTFEKLQMYELLVRVNIRIAQVYDAETDYKSAIRYYEKAIEIGEKNNIVFYLGNAYSEAANIISVRFKDYPKALKYYNKALIIDKKLNSPENQHIAEMNIGVLYSNLGQYDKAMNLLFKTLRFFQKNNTSNGTGEIQTLAEIGKIYFLKKEYKKAEEFIKLSIEKSKVNHEEILETKVSSMDLLQKIYAAQGQLKLAYQTQNDWRILYDSMTNLSHKKNVAILQTKFETTQKEAQIKALDNENSLRTKQLVWAIIGLSVLAVSLLVSLLLYQKLKDKNLKIESQSKQLSNLMKELHHRVKNNLAMVSSLLSIQSKKLEDKEAAKAVREGQLRVQAMSMIHQKLYNTDDIATLNMQQYLQELAENLIQIYGFSKSEFNLEIRTENPELDIDLAIPIGLIVNELVTNAMKYAYNDTPKPSLNINFKNLNGIFLRIKDNGKGFDLSKKSKSGFGQEMIKGLTKQIGGKSNFFIENGTVFELEVVK